ncbi:MAG: tail fiber domain-containing protein [Elusimicrobia bacterium]|nr:tail fiber domain-containing protein [Elusimicrobiota bacterium]
MRIHSQDFKNAISTYGREVKHKITYWQNYEEVELEDILSINSITNADLLKTVMKELDFNSKKQLDKGTIIKYQLGIKVNDEYEYLNFGEYIVKENDWNADTNSFAHVCYDAMLNTMIDYYTPASITFPITVNMFIKRLVFELGFDFANYNIPFCNSETLINEDHFNNGNYTFRDVLDYLAEIVGGFIIINKDGDIEIKHPTVTNEVFNGDFLRDVNITFKNKYGAVNSIVFARGGGSDTIYRKDDNDIATNGLHELRFDDNPFLEGIDRENFIDNVYEELHGLEFYVMDINSPGICYLEVGDYFTFELNQNSAMKSGIAKSGLYKSQSQTGGMIKCLMLNDEIDFSSGINEYIYADEPMSSVTNYKTSAPTDNSIKNAIITTNKNAGQIVLKVNSEGKIVQVELNADANNGTIFNVDADNINLTANDILNLIAGNSINLTTRNMTIDSTNFSVDKNGNTTCNNLTINGGKVLINAQFTEQNPYLKINHPNSTDYAPIMTNIWGDGISCINYQGIPTIRTENSNGFAQLNGHVVDAFGFNNISLAEKKKDFELLQSGLDIIDNIDIYKYRYKNEEGNKKHIGLVIGNKYKYSKEITNDKNNAVDVYSLVGVCCKAIQEQQQQIELLKQEIKLLKERNDK